MWKATLSKSVKELRFVLKQTPEHHGVWNFVQKSLPEIRMLNQNTFFTVTEIDHNFKAASACHILYNDSGATEDLILSEGLSLAQFQTKLQEKVAFGETLPRFVPANNSQRSMPKNIVEARNTVAYMDDAH